MPDPNKSFAYSIDSEILTVGSFSLRINNWSRDLIKLIIDEDRYLNLINKQSLHEHLNTYSSFWEEFYDQASWYSLAGIKRHSDKSFWKMPNFGWHSNKDEWTKFTLEELYKNVQIFPTNYNVTELPGESKCTYNINKINYNNVYIRHFQRSRMEKRLVLQKNLQFREQFKFVLPVKSYKTFIYLCLKIR